MIEGQRRLPSQEDQRVIFDVMEAHFEDMMGLEGGVTSDYAQEETKHMLAGFEEAGYAQLPVEVLSRAALRSAATKHAFSKLTPQDFV